MPALDVRAQISQGFKCSQNGISHFPPVLQVQSEYMSGASNSTSYATSVALPDLKFRQTSLSSPIISTRPPPLPPNPPPYSGNSSFTNSTSQPQYFQTVGNSELQQPSGAPLMNGMMNLSASHPMLTSYPQPPLMQPLLFRPGSMPVNPYGNSLSSHQGDQNLPISMHSVQPMPTLSKLQPLQPPQIPRPPPQHLRPSVPSSPQSEQGVQQLMHSSLQIPAHPSQMLQQPQVSPGHVYYQTQQQESVSRPLQHQHADHSQRISRMPGDSSSQQDPAMSLQEFFKSPQAIQVLRVLASYNYTT